MGFQESGHSSAYITNIVNRRVASLLSINPPNRKNYGLIIRYQDDGNICKELIDDKIELDAIYKICRSNVTDMFYLLTKIYIGQVKYTDFIHFVKTISNKLNKIKEIQQTVKSEKERFQRLNKLEMEIRKITANARKTLLITQ